MTTPLEEAIPDSLSTLMSRNPCSQSDQEIEEIVNILREAAKRWKEKPERKEKALPLTLEDLGLA